MLLSVFHITARQEPEVYSTPTKKTFKYCTGLVFLFGILCHNI